MFLFQHTRLMMSTTAPYPLAASLQMSGSMAKLSERNCVEVIMMLQKLNMYVDPTGPLDVCS
jgi:hypothetical protein